jgi:hypothetical protein
MRCPFLIFAFGVVIIGASYVVGVRDEDFPFQGAFQATFFLKLCARASKPVSTVTFSIPRSMKRLK